MFFFPRFLRKVCTRLHFTAYGSDICVQTDICAFGENLQYTLEVKMSSDYGNYSFLGNFSDSYSYEWEGYPLPRQISVGVIIGIIILLTIAGNAMVMAAFYRDRRINSKIANWYIVNLSVADFSVGFFSLTLTLAWELKSWWVFGKILCRIYLFVDYVVVTVPVCSIMCISLDRYWLVTKKLNYPKYATKTKAKLLIGTTWVFCIVFYGILTYGWVPISGLAEVIDYSWNCELEATYNVGIQLFMIAFFFILPLIIISGLNLIVYLNIYKRSKGFVQSNPIASQGNKQATHASDSHHDASRSNLELTDPGTEKGNSDLSMISLSVQNQAKLKENTTKTLKPQQDKKRSEFNRHRKAAITLAVLVGVFIVCWLPFYIASIMSAVCGECFPYLIWTVSNYLLWANSMINPFLYAAMNIHFRENFIKFLGLNRFMKKSQELSKTMSTSGE